MDVLYFTLCTSAFPYPSPLNTFHTDCILSFGSNNNSDDVVVVVDDDNRPANSQGSAVSLTIFCHFS